MPPKYINSLLQVFLFLILCLFLPFQAVSQDEQIYRATKVWTSMEVGTNSFFVSNIDVAITTLYFDSKKKLDSVSMIIERKDSMIEKRPLQGKMPYQYLEIIKSGISDSDISSIIIEFRVEKSWINSNSIDGISIKLYRYDSNWIEQNTGILTKEDDTYYYYQTRSSALGNFLIAGEKKAAEEIIIKEPAEEPLAEPEINENEPSQKFDIKYLYLFVIFFFVIIGVLFIYKDRIFSKKSNKRGLDELNNYIKEAKSQGEYFAKIRGSLIDEGWDENTVDMAMHGVSLPEDQTKNLKKYIGFALKKGKSKEDIRKELKAVGWQEEVVDQVLKSV